MRYAKKIVFRFADGAIAVTTPVDPVRGVYIVPLPASMKVKVAVPGKKRRKTVTVTERRFTVDGIGAAGTALSARAIAALDEAVARGEAHFVPAETEEQYLTRIAAATLQKNSGRGPDGLPGALDGAQWVGTISAEAHACADRSGRDRWTWSSESAAIDMGPALPAG
jgi:hypothetical protein